MTHNEIEIYIDGSYLPKLNQGAFAVITIETDPLGEQYIEKHQSSVHKNTTSLKMEFLGCIHGFKDVAARIKRGEEFSRISLFTDSAYITDNRRKAMFDWSKRGWKYPSGKPVGESDLWKQLITALKAIPQNVSIEWVKGHGKNEHNRAVHELARQAAELTIAARTQAVFVYPRVKLSSSPMERGSVKALGQKLIIRIINSDWSSTHQAWQHKYEVISPYSAYFRKVDIAYSKESLSNDRTYKVRMNKSAKNPWIIRVYEE